MDSQTRLLRGSEVIDLKKILQLLGRRRALLFGVVSIVSISAAITVFYLPPLYTAETTILIESEHKNIVKIDSVIAPYLQDRTVVENQTLILQSRTFIRKIVKTLKLDEDPAFNSELDSSQSGETFWKKIDPRQVLPKRFLNAFSPPANLTKLTQNEKEDLLMKSLVTKVLKNLEIEPIRKTRGIQISYTSKYPRKAALIVNTIAEQYIVEQLDAKFEATRKATKWLSERISVLKKKVEESEKAVEMYKKESGLGSASGLPSQQVAEFSRQLMEVRSQRREAEASLGQMNLMADSPEGVGSMGKVLSSRLYRAYVSEKLTSLEKFLSLRLNTVKGIQK